MAEDEGKTEEPTAKKLRDGRKEGQFARTPDAAIWLGVGAAAAMIPQTGRNLSEAFTTLFSRVASAIDDPSPAVALDALTRMPMAVALAAGPLTVAAMVATILGGAVQGVYVSGKALQPKASRLSPKQGLKRMFGLKAIWEAAKALIKVAVITGVVLVLARSTLPEIIGSGLVPLGVTLEQTRAGVVTLLWTTVVTGLLLAIGDYLVSRRQVMKQLRMTPREIKDEVRQSEGDPMVKSARRARQMAMSRSRMLNAVMSADVVLVNPTHYAVALKYEPHRGAPRVVAKGTDALALKIRERAREHRVPVVEDKPLARLLHRVCDVDDEIPAELYLAVARILAFVMAAGRPAANATPRRPTNGVTLPTLPSKAVLRTRRARETREARSQRRPPAPASTASAAQVPSPASTRGA